MKKKITKFDKKEYFKRECQPLLNDLVNKCSVHDLPFFFSACVESTENETVYIADGVMTGSKDIVLFDDRIKRHMLVQSGLDVRPKATEIEIPEIILDDVTDEVL